MSSPHNFSNQMLRHRSFRGQPLNGANFSGSDIRGCDFSHAQLRGANFTAAKAGQPIDQLLRLLLVAGFSLSISFYAISGLVFAILGRTVEEPDWSFVAALHGALALSSLSAAIAPFWVAKPLHRILQLISAAASGGLLGCFYCSIISGNNLTAAIWGAAASSTGLALVFDRVRNWAEVRVAVAVAAAVAAYGLTFLLGTSAIACGFAGSRLFTLLWSSLCALFLAVTLKLLQHSVKTVRQAGRTSFRGADLTDAQFKDARIENVDFADTSGMLTLLQTQAIDTDR